MELLVPMATVVVFAGIAVTAFRRECEAERREAEQRARAEAAEARLRLLPGTADRRSGT